VVPLKDLSLPPARESTADIAARVARARALQQARYAGLAVLTNAEADGALLEEVAAPTPEGRHLLDTAGTRYALSARGYHRVLKVARTIADLAGDTQVAKPHIAEALSFRPIPVETP
jgi:magnesium chelatase family protein